MIPEMNSSRSTRSMLVSYPVELPAEVIDAPVLPQPLTIGVEERVQIDQEVGIDTAVPTAYGQRRNQTFLKR